MNPRYRSRSPYFQFGKRTLLFIALLCLRPVSSEAQIRPKLQWFDAHGEIIDLDWATSVQWIWSQERIPVAQVIINIPEQLNLALSDESQAKFTNGVPDRDGKSSNRTLVVDMEGPRKTIKLRKIDPQAESKEIGLTIVLSTVSPNIIPSESCLREGIAVEPRQAEANFIFLAVSCKKTNLGLRIFVESSNDALLGKDEDDELVAHSSLNPLIVLISKKAMETMRQDSVVATIKAESQTTPPITTQFELVYTKESEAKAETAKLKALAQSDSPTPFEKKPWLLTAELGLGFLGYQSGVRNQSDSAEFNLKAKLTAEHAISDSRTHFKADLAAPLVTLMPDAHFPPSGFYKGTARASFTIFDRGRIAFHLEPGVEAGGAQFRNRPELAGLYAGPVLAAFLNGTVGGLNNRAMSLLTSFGALAGRGIDPLFHSYDFSTELSTEVIKGDAGKRWDLVLRYNYLNFRAPKGNDARTSEMTFGIRTGF